MFNRVFNCVYNCVNNNAGARALTAIAVLLFIAGCGPQAVLPPTATPYTIQTRNAIATINRIVAPTWTASPRPTARPSRTPFPTATVTHTPDAQAVCSAFVLVSAPLDGAFLAYEGRIQFTWANAPEGSAVLVAVRREGTGDPELRARVPYGGDGVIQIPFDVLPGAGRFTWRLVVSHPIYGEICAQTGLFVRREPAAYGTATSATGPTVAGPTVAGPTVAGPTVTGPTVTPTQETF